MVFPRCLDGVMEVCERCFESILKVSGSCKCVYGVLKVVGKCLISVLQVSYRGLEGAESVLKVSGKRLEDIKLGQVYQE